jgi:hypothetical protein
MEPTRQPRARKGARTSEESAPLVCSATAGRATVKDASAATVSFKASSGVVIKRSSTRGSLSNSDAPSASVFNPARAAARRAPAAPRETNARTSYPHASSADASAVPKRPAPTIATEDLRGEVTDDFCGDRVEDFRDEVF